MQPLDNESETPDSMQSPPLAASTMRLPKTRAPAGDAISLTQSEASLPYPKSNPLFASTLTPPGSRSASPAGRRSPSRAYSGSVFGSGANRAPLDLAADSPGDPLNLILRAFVPHVAIYSSQDTHDLLRDKGFDDGLWELLRPFGERVQGKVSIRDSNGMSRTWDDFSVRFVRLGEHIEPPGNPLTPQRASQSATNGSLPAVQAQASAPGTARLAEVESVVEKHLTYAEQSFLGLAPSSTPTTHGLDIEIPSPYYALYLRRILSAVPLSPHETFAHPVACVIAISSRNPSPIETLRRLYSESSQGERKLPPWVDNDYLRYYVLVHDEENGDIGKSTALFEQMKRHLGLHCHLLRLRSSQSAETDDDAIPLPRSDWMSASEELAEISRSESNDELGTNTRYIYESDATAIRTFIREMVTQSIIPTMERNVSLWNDQVASRRRGIGGRLMTFSKRWTGFGGSSKSLAGGGGGSNSSGGGGGGGINNFDALGFYRPETQEAIMRKLADFAFMLRDWKLAMSTYDLLRSDYSNDKAWKHHAAAHEMTALSLLIMPQNMSSRTRTENVNQMLEAAFYSYHTRCVSPYGALRCLLLGMELLRLRGGSAIDEAAKWGIKLLETRIVRNIGEALIKERMAVCYATRQGMGSLAWGARRRKSALWSVLGAEDWIAQAKYVPAQRCLNEARMMYSLLPNENGIDLFADASSLMKELEQRMKEGLDLGLDENSAGSGEDEDVEVLADDEGDMVGRRSRRTSLLGTPRATAAGLETAPLRALTSGDEGRQGTLPQTSP